MNLMKPSSYFSFLNIFFLYFLLLHGHVSSVDGYDSLDPNGNITIKWDIISWDDDSYVALVSIYNYQLFRHIERPGWRLSWRWNGGEVISSMVGAEATEQGNCKKIRRRPLPHSCKKKPVIIDLLPGAPYTMQVANCCKGGVLTTIDQDPAKYGASFQLSVGNTVPFLNSTDRIDDEGSNKTQVDNVIPRNFSLGLPGYTCSMPRMVPASRFDEDGGRRHRQAFYTWNITCSYSQTVASDSPTCCVSLSSFYNNTIVPCPKCSCACLDHPGTHCVDPDQSSIIDLPHGEDEVLPPRIRCTQHMCPIRVHWHVKTSYKEYWRVKMTVNNFNYVKNYSHWSLVVQHPNLRSVEQVFSFNYKSLNPHAFNDTGMFWGLQYYNEMLLQAGDTGNVQTEFLLHKDFDPKLPDVFTFKGGWAFPRKISFNGDLCVMPPPDQFPRLPNSSFSLSITSPSLFSLFIFLLIFIML